MEDWVAYGYNARLLRELCSLSVEQMARMLNVIPEEVIALEAGKPVLEQFNMTFELEYFYGINTDLLGFESTKYKSEVGGLHGYYLENTLTENDILRIKTRCRVYTLNYAGLERAVHHFQIPVRKAPEATETCSGDISHDDISFHPVDDVKYYLDGDVLKAQPGYVALPKAKNDYAKIVTHGLMNIEDMPISNRTVTALFHAKVLMEDLGDSFTEITDNLGQTPIAQIVLGFDGIIPFDGRYAGLQHRILNHLDNVDFAALKIFYDYIQELPMCEFAEDTPNGYEDYLKIRREFMCKYMDWTV